MTITTEQKNLLCRLFDYLGMSPERMKLPQKMPEKGMYIRWSFTTTSPYEYHTILQKIPEDIRQGLLNEGVQRLSVRFDFHSLGDGEAGEGGAAVVGHPPICVNLETRITYEG